MPDLEAFEKHDYLRIESRWNPNLLAKSRKTSSISSFDKGMLRSADHAGYGSLTPGVGVSDVAIREPGISDSAEGS